MVISMAKEAHFDPLVSQHTTSMSVLSEPPLSSSPTLPPPAHPPPLPPPPPPLQVKRSI